jgi:hypothetical protein
MKGWENYLTQGGGSSVGFIEHTAKQKLSEWRVYYSTATAILVGNYVLQDENVVFIRISFCQRTSRLLYQFCGAQVGGRRRLVSLLG